MRIFHLSLLCLAAVLVFAFTAGTLEAQSPADPNVKSPAPLPGAAPDTGANKPPAGAHPGPPDGPHQGPPPGGMKPQGPGQGPGFAELTPEQRAQRRSLMADFLSKARGIVEDLKDQELLYKAYIGNSNVKTEDIKGVVGEMRKLRDQLRGHIDTLRDDFSKNKLGAPHIPRGILRYLTHHDSGSGNRMGRRVFDSPFAGMRFGRDDGRSKNLYTDRGAPSNPSPNPGPAQDGGKPAPANPERGTSPGAHLGALVATPGDSQEGYYEDYTFDDSYSQGAYTDDAYAEDDY